MCRRNVPPFNGHRYVGDRRTMLVHDLDHEDPDVRGCGITGLTPDSIEVFEPDTLKQAYRQGYEFCPSCIGE